MTQPIKNPATQVPETPQMNDRDFMNDCLMTEKYLTMAYSVAVHEMSHQALYQDVMNIFQETEKCQRNLYDMMFRKGWYGLEEADQQKVQQTYQQFTQYSASQFSH
ncbi:spore coat protein [Camelliibacillus cellulosilyticus]|uniref:Spore coat protein n=1 Tax=Camelliibacillus cellulosilyticus TaxID=2174486 RepID=A0ABV9GJF6_9BACL